MPGNVADFLPIRGLEINLHRCIHKHTHTQRIDILSGPALRSAPAKMSVSRNKPLDPETDVMDQFLNPETDIKDKFLDGNRETDIMDQFLDPETGIMGEGN